MRNYIKILLSLFLFSSLYSSELKRAIKVVPLSASFLSVENGGTASCPDALNDGVIDNGTVSDRELALKLNPTNNQEEEPKIGDTCDDLNPLTENDMYIEELGNIVCKGEIPLGEPCDDLNPLTENDMYIEELGNIVCKGEIPDSFAIKCEGVNIGDSIQVEGISYLVVDNNTIKNNLNNAEFLCTSNVTDMSYLFLNKNTFNQDIGRWDVSKVSSMTSMFHNATNFNKPLNSWNTSNVKLMLGMFYNATSFNQPLNSWNTSSVTDMSSMFYQASSFNQPLNSWDTSSVTLMATMFYQASSFNQDISSWDVDNATNMGNMFRDATVFNQDLSSWCVSNFSSLPVNFDNNTPSWTLPKPIWGTCN